jgi:hypothetical protein
MACRHPHETTGHRPPVTPQRPRRPDRSTNQQRSPPRTAADPHAALPPGDQANASAPAPPDQIDAASAVPSQLLTVEVLRRPLESAQYTSFAFTQRLIDAGVNASVGSVGDAYDNALAESTIGLYKTEKIRREGPWRTLAEVELATLEWVDWFNTSRLHSACGRLSPAQFEQRYIDNLLTQ